METPQEYTKRILGNIGDRDPWSQLASTPARLRALTGPARAKALAYAPAGRWSTAQILAHLADTEIVAAWRLRSILAMDGVDLQAFDQNTWASAFKYEQADPAESLALFEVLRSANLRLLKTVDPARHQHHGLHQERGKETIMHLVRLYAGHDLNHLGQIERLLAEARALG
ncbi:MAG TPA: DinB family protein [Vicinamibacterales bacterium]|jgi:hypothetical protein|nr:DinB family protein [Vicinamibacterales bacterium]